jgi:hypothetical protein
MICFLHSFYKGIFESSMGTHTAFLLCFAFKTLLLLLASFTLRQKLRESLGRLGKDENLVAS